MTNEEIVLGSISNKIKYRKLSALKFRDDGRINFNDDINHLKNLQSIDDRVYEIVCLCRRYITIHYKGENFQCRSGANRSAVDIMCIYKFYFGDIDLFTILRTLYRLVSERRISTLKCSDIHKQVFWKRGLGDNYSMYYETTEFGIKFDEWMNIGLEVK